MENTKQEMIDAVRALLDANEKNPHCDEHWLSDLIREELEQGPATGAAVRGGPLHDGAHRPVCEAPGHKPQASKQASLE